MFATAAARHGAGLTGGVGRSEQGGRGRARSELGRLLQGQVLEARNWG